MKKALIFDSGTLISFSMNGLLSQLEELKKIFDGEFIITPEVKSEVIDKPLTIKRFELEALNIKNLLDKGVLKLPRHLGISLSEIRQETDKVMGLANNAYYGKRPIDLIELGEASCFALSEMLSKKGISTLITIDERTARSIVETPEDLRSYLSKKLHTDVKINPKNQKYFSQFRIIRSTELVYVVYKKGLIEIKDPSILDALLYAMKAKGCAISYEEIEQIKRIG